jgi:(2Fe-2S) ferredoxin
MGMSHSHKQISDFNLQGRLLGFVFEDGYKLKYLRLATAEGELCIKMAKPLRVSFDRSLMPGDWVRVAGETKLDRKTGESKQKAYILERTAPAVTHAPLKVSAAPAPAAQPKATILVCQKSDCCQRGARQVCQAIEASLRERGLEDRVTVKGTGCIKQCKMGPNVVVMPDKTRYSRCHPSEVPGLIEKHFCEGTVREDAGVRRLTEVK